MLPSEIFKITDEEKLLIAKSHGKSKEEIEELLEELKEWITTQPHIPQDQDEILLRMLIGLNKFKMEKIKKKLDMFYAIRNIVPDFYKDRSPLSDQIQTTIKHYTITPIANLLPGQKRLYICRFTGETDVGPFDVLALARAVFLLYDLRIHHDAATEEIMICDLQHIRLHHVVRMSPLVVTRIYSVLEKGYSDRIKGIHFINIPSIANILVSLVKYILSFKLANRVHTHKNLQSLHEHFSQENLPCEYGGNLKSLHEFQADWMNFMESQDTWLIEQGNKRTNEKLRPEKSKSPGMFNSLLHIFRKNNYSNEAPL